MPELSPDTRAIINAMSETKGDMDSKLAEVIDTQRQLLHDVRELRDGFPDGDAAAHRRYHESLIEWRETRNKLVREALTTAVKAGGLAGIGWVGYALWIAFKMEITR